MNSSTRLSQALSNLESVTTHLHFLSAKKKTYKSRALQDEAEEAEEQFEMLIPRIRQEYPKINIDRESDTVLRLRLYEDGIPVRKHERPYVWIKYKYEHQHHDNDGWPYGPADLFQITDEDGHWYPVHDVDGIMYHIRVYIDRFRTSVERGGFSQW
jgi:hypothetical protein